ncbi:gallidermin/nisin family lantibiotic [Paenibacillus sp. PsM32]|uniref:Lantibiotic n=1 Tax=Paenibacillus kyungheensis TaxID=1452732 RepID=A0AAX3M1Y7_9BACL|nr:MULTISPECIES: gallidermin/nisin family lantibiotic [Paenibacillus]MDN4619145.1 gallidermin/nisin family lantibiotic [Paenibacillus sp. PsM32]WCT56179.1 gallidermin/nisin family lantibiotic [Paenibacillus kyungheensis]
MAKFNDFDLDLVQTPKPSTQIEPQWKSQSFCTPGCVTGVLQTCFIQTATCNCHISK